MRQPSEAEVLQMVCEFVTFSNRRPTAEDVARAISSTGEPVGTRAVSRVLHRLWEQGKVVAIGNRNPAKPVRWIVPSKGGAAR